MSEKDKIKNGFIENEYKSRIFRIFDYIETHIDRQFTLDELASVANFSKYHFHRIFLAIVGETPFQFIMRVRLEKAASFISMNPTESITEIAFKCGFTDISVFSRNFKAYFNISASGYRKQHPEFSNISQLNSKKEQVEKDFLAYFCPDSKTLKWRSIMNFCKSAEVKEFPEMTVAYVRHIGPYKGDQQLFDRLWGKLCSWAGANNLLQQPDVKFLIIYHDDPNVTAEDKLRMSVCLSVPENTKVDGEIGKMKIDAGKYLVARFEISGDQFTDAWAWVYGQWFPNSGYQPDDGPCFELYPEEPKDGRFVVDICVSVKPL